jgi:hypothetical protein
MAMKKNLVQQIKSFIESSESRNSWFSNKNIEVYIRMSWRNIGEEELVKVLDIANISAKKTGEGTFTELLNELEMYVKDSLVTNCIFIENVVTDQFAGFFRKRGYIEKNICGGMFPGTPCFYKVIS